MMNLGPVVAGSTVRIMFTTHAQTGAAVAPLSAFEAADVILYKDGSATQRTVTTGWTMTSPFDSIVGLHQIAFDLSDNSDAGFYAAGSSYVAVLSPDETVDGLAVVAVIGTFTIGAPAVNAEVVDCLNVDTYAEPAGAPAATSTLRAKIGWIFKLLRNRRKQTSTTETLYADDATTADATSTKSDSGTEFERGEWTA